MNEKLLKAAHKALAAHFHKAASHHEAMAGHHEAMAEAHKAHGEMHEKMHQAAYAKAAGGAEDELQKVHKAHAAFHKTMHGYHSALHKSHTAHAAHLKKMAEAHGEPDADDQQKIAKYLIAAGVEMTNDPTPTTPAAVAAPTTTPAATPAAPADPTPTPAAKAAGSGEGSDIQSVLNKTLDDKLTKAIDDAVTRVLNSAEFSKTMDERLAGKLLEKLGNAPNPTEVKTFAVPRTPAPGDVAKTATVDTSRVPAEFADMLSFGDQA